MMPNGQIKKIILKAAENIPSIYLFIAKENFIISPINNNVSGHYCSNFFFNLNCNSEDKEKFLSNLIEEPLIEKAEIIKGYLNLTFKAKFFAKRAETILKENVSPNIGKETKVNVEFCSVNPTGYLHIGHARNAILGDCIARILEKTNYKVTKEYYVNDGGNQIDLMAESIYARFCEIKEIEYPFPENGYKGPEMYDVAKTLPENILKEEIKTIGVKFFLNNIRKDLNRINIYHDAWIYESQIINENYIEKALKILKEKNCIVFDKRESKKVKKGSISSNKLMLLKTTKFGDDQDRPLTKEDGSWTYFAPDIGYHLYKIERNFKILICTLGADHDSYAKRIKIATKVLNEEIIHKVQICQMVSFENKGILVKFSKRQGNSIRISDFVKEISADILRFSILEKSADTQFIFNYETASNITMKNPLFYCQYAFARGCSILRNIEQSFIKQTNINHKKWPILNATENSNVNNIEEQTINLESEFFSNKEVQSLIITIDNFQQIITESANELAPHKLIHYTKKLCEKMHKLWQIGKIEAKNRIIIENNLIETNTRKLVIECFIKIAKECFHCIGIQAPEKME